MPPCKELDLHKDDAQRMCNELRQAIVSKKPEINLSGEVEFDEVYVTAGHKGQPDEVKKKVVRAVVGSSKGFAVEGLSKRKNRQSSG